MEEIYTEKEILGDALNTEKNATALYNLSANAESKKIQEAKTKFQCGYKAV